MERDPLFIAAMIAALMVLAVLVLGIASFGTGGEFNRKHANRLMRWRIILQFVAVVLILLFTVVARGSS